jgi:hypothetical protein
LFERSKVVCWCYTLGNFYPEASSGEFAVAMWHQVSCFVVSYEMVWTSVPPSPVVSIVEDRKVGMPTYFQTAEEGV